MIAFKHRMSPFETVRIGNYHHVGPKYLVSKLRRALSELGRIAVFAGENGEVGAISYRHEQFDRHCRKHAGDLVGVYQSTLENTAPSTHDLDVIEADLRHHIAATSKGARAA